MNDPNATAAAPPSETGGSGRTALKRSALSVAAALLGAYGAGALITFSPDDPSLNVATDAAAKNLFGEPGALYADLLMQTLGAGGYVLSGALLAAGVGRILNKRLHAPLARERLLSGAAGVALGCAALSCVPTPPGWPLAAGLGGVLGDGTSNILTAIYALPGLPGARALAGFTAAVGAAIALGWSFRVTRDDVAAVVERATHVARGARRLAHGAALAITDRTRAAPEADPWEDYRRRLEQQPIPVHVVTPEPQIEPQRTRPAPAATPQPEPRAPRPVAQPTAAPQAAPAAARAHRSHAPSPRGPGFHLPSLDLLEPPRARAAQTDGAALQAQAKRLAAVLADFGVHGEIVSARPGPVVTLFELEPAPGVKSSRVIGLAEDISRSMSANACRVAVVPGRNAIGIEMPNPKREMVFLRSLLGSTAFVGAQGALPLALGETIEGEPFCADLSKMPHLLIAGTTGSGKSVGINAMILSLLYRHTPDECRFIMIDPKMLELSIYEGIPHLLSPVVTDPKKAVVALKWTVREMEERYRRMSKLGVRNIQGYNERVEQALSSGEKLERRVHTGFDHTTGEPIYETQELPLEKMPFIVVVIDEMADLMITAGREIEAAVQRLAQMARAAGIHVIMATQRPSVDVITGVIKANFPTRLAYTVPTRVDSRTIIGEQGAEQLLGQGDCLFMAGGGRIRRLHGPFVDDDEVLRIVAMLKAQGSPSYRSDVTEDEEAAPSEAADLLEAAGLGSTGDDLFDRAVEIVARDRKASTSYLQRRLNIGYNRAASLIEKLEKEGIISEANHAGRREIMVPAIGEE
jgi:S-DNA-T family DNA segregation ATPase FtsK/SpoIIIE